MGVSVWGCLLHPNLMQNLAKIYPWYCIPWPSSSLDIFGTFGSQASQIIRYLNPWFQIFFRELEDEGTEFSCYYKLYIYVYCILPGVAPPNFNIHDILTFQGVMVMITMVESGSSNTTKISMQVLGWKIPTCARQKPCNPNPLLRTQSGFLSRSHTVIQYIPVLPR